jgi:plasmid stabilization system protein ParE
MSRPSKYTQKIADEICELLSDGQSLREICKSDTMPNRSAVFRWLAQDATFRDQYARAREAQADAIFDEILHIADTPQTGQKTVSKATGLEVTEADMIEHRRLQVDARKWIAGKLAPKKYGDKLDVGIGGIDGAPAVKINIVKANT